MTHRIAAALTVSLVALAGAAPALAQNRTEMQLMADMRMLHEEMQQTRLLINALAEQIKTTTARLDALDRSLVKGFADQKLDLDEMTTSVARLGDKVSDNSVRVGQFASELTSIREGIGLSNTMLDQIVKAITPPPVVDPAAAADPAATPPGAALPPLTTPPAGAGTVTQPAPGATPRSAVAAWGQANGLYFAARYELAAEELRLFVKEFPNDPNAPLALYNAGMSYYQLNDLKSAMTAFTEVVATYPQSERVPDALYFQGFIHEQQKRLPEARKLYQQVIKTYPESVARARAEQRLQRIGGGDGGV
jgi:tol-pal system protein YbgF